MDVVLDRLRRRMEYLGLGVGETAARCGVSLKHYSRYLTGTAKRGFPPDLFLAVCRALGITPNQAYGLEPMEGVDLPPADATEDREAARIAACLNVLPPGEQALAAELLETLVRGRSAP